MSDYFGKPAQALRFLFQWNQSVNVQLPLKESNVIRFGDQLYGFEI